MHFNFVINYIDMHFITFLKLKSKIFTKKLSKEDTKVKVNLMSI